VRGCASGLTSTDGTVVDDVDVTAGTGEEIGCGEAGDSGADDADVGLDVLAERLTFGHR
jgi:hypothetical protein